MRMALNTIQIHSTLAQAVTISPTIPPPTDHENCFHLEEDGAGFEEAEGEPLGRGDVVCGITKPSKTFWMILILTAPRPAKGLLPRAPRQNDALGEAGDLVAGAEGAAGGEGEDARAGGGGERLVPARKGGDHGDAGNVGVARKQVAADLEGQAGGMVAGRRVNVCGDAVEQRDPGALVADLDTVRREHDRIAVVLRHVEPRIRQRHLPGSVRINPQLREQRRQVRQPVDMVIMRMRQQHALHGVPFARQGGKTLQQRLHIAAIHDPERLLPLVREDVRPGR